MIRRTYLEDLHDEIGSLTWSVPLRQRIQQIQLRLHNERESAFDISQFLKNGNDMVIPYAGDMTFRNLT